VIETFDRKELLERISDRTNRDTRISVRMTPNEQKMLRMVAESSNESLSEFLRETSLDVARAILRAHGEEPIA